MAFRSTHCEDQILTSCRLLLLPDRSRNRRGCSFLSLPSLSVPFFSDTIFFLFITGPRDSSRTRLRYHHDHHHRSSSRYDNALDASARHGLRKSCRVRHSRGSPHQKGLHLLLFGFSGWVGERGCFGLGFVSQRRKGKKRRPRWFICALLARCVRSHTILDIFLSSEIS